MGAPNPDGSAGDADYGRIGAGARRANSAWSFVDETSASESVERLRADLASGRWDEQHSHLRNQPTYAGSRHRSGGRSFCGHEPRRG